MARARREDIGGRTYCSYRSPRRRPPTDSLAHLPPIYDEHSIAYRDREVVPHGPGIVSSTSSAPVTFQHAAGSPGRWLERANRQGREGSIDCCDTLRRLTERDRRKSRARQPDTSASGKFPWICRSTVDWTTGRSRGLCRARQPSRQAAINRCGARGSAMDAARLAG
jgi:hypothetical protein